MKSMLLAMALVFGMGVQAQLTSTRAELSAEPGGEPIAVLSDSVRVLAIPQPDRFCRVSQSFLVKVSDTEDGSVRAGAGLFNEQKDSVGKLFVDYKADLEPLKGKKYKNYARFEFKGYVHRGRLISSTIPEEEIAEALGEKNKGKQEARLGELYAKEGFVLKETGELSVRVQRMGGPEATEEDAMRVMVVSRAGGAVIGVVCNGGHLELPKVKETRTEQGWTMYYLQKPSAAIHEAVVEVGLSFMPL